MPRRRAKMSACSQKCTPSMRREFFPSGHRPGSSQDELPTYRTPFEGDNPTQKRSRVVIDLHLEEEQQ